MKRKAGKEPFEMYFMRSLFRAQVLLATMSDTLFIDDKKLTISFSQFLVLRAIESANNNGEEASQITIAKALSITAPAVSRHIDNLLMLGHVVCHINKRNKRQHLLELSRKGEKAVEDASALLIQETEELFAHISVTNRNALTKSLDGIIESCEKL